MVGYIEFTDCYWQSSAVTESGTEDGNASEITGDWHKAIDSMNAALSNTDYSYVMGSDGYPVLM